MNVLRVSVFILLLAVCVSLQAIAQNSATVPGKVHHVSGTVPVQGASTELSADRPYVAPTPMPQVHTQPNGNTWTLQATIPGAVIHDISFSSALVGYAVAEGGQIWKTTNGGAKWTEALNLGYPYYFYGVDAINAKNIVASGFYDSSTFYGFIRWSHDGGQTWGSDIVLTNTGWVQRVRFLKKNGLILDLINGAENTAQYTADGGRRSDRLEHGGRRYRRRLVWPGVQLAEKFACPRERRGLLQQHDRWRSVELQSRASTRSSTARSSSSTMIKTAGSPAARFRPT